MNVLRTGALAVVFLVSLASNALGQQGGWFEGDVHQQHFFTALRSLSLSDDQRNIIRDIVGDGYMSGQNDQEIDRRIFAVLTSDQAQTLRNRLSASGDNGYGQNGYGYGQNGYGNGYGYGPNQRPSFVAVVHEIKGGAITLTNGHTAFLRDATALIPSRDAIKPGSRVGVEGTHTADGNINADLVQVLDGMPVANFGDLGSITAGGNFGVVASTTNSNLTLQNGRTVFMRDDTLVSPGRDALQPGVRLVIYGLPAGNGNINADRIEVVGGP